MISSGASGWRNVRAFSFELLTAAHPDAGESVAFPQCGPTRGRRAGSVQLRGWGIMPLLNIGAAFVLEPNEHSS